MTRKDIPNLISVMRILLVIPVVMALLDEQFALALLLFAVAGVSDGLDGFLAKQFQWQSRLGSILDPLADKLLLMASFTSLTILGFIPWWLLLAVIARDVIIVTGGLAYHYLIGRFELMPLWSSKINTFLQIALVLLVIIQQQWFPGLEILVTAGIWLVLASVINSGSEYIIVWGLKAWRQLKQS
ncbi:CDP-diacylglycerol--glycerol-3-phosphate 3-phosphatidyltransferase [Methylophaga lonarensis MPL]|uniref:CDP-diacylglycerol--glycerol-3-phosphate 3-phosphatidyltransferase n=1 Tax=Methylophaga lonarensis MPL TaxID=1286106 RepID=M7P049_9GAMM|nr:CDP-alcohol phosphatidyltransferase family protein [Methylophaga lonarensis]EMR12836.1 CDP-diacylglycerol--glycerol-3-phosphate 3-phosphatidyltransferase [Methylophaga lonarensis MPL]